MTRKWTYERLADEAGKYKTKKEFEKCCAGGYKAAREAGIINNICTHMISGRFKYTIDEVITRALRYSSRIEFQKLDRSAYRCAHTMGIIDDICSHMIPLKTFWTDESLRAEAQKYNNRKAFSDGSESAYKSAIDRGILEDICSHMVRLVGGLNAHAPAILYYIRFDVENEHSLYKIGITNLSVEKRIESMQVKNNINAIIIKEISFNTGTCARKVEKLLHRRFKHNKYRGTKILGNGNTELFIKDILGLDNGN